MLGRDDQRDTILKKGRHPKLSLHVLWAENMAHTSVGRVPLRGAK